MCIRDSTHTHTHTLTKSRVPIHPGKIHLKDTAILLGPGDEVVFPSQQLHLEVAEGVVDNVQFVDYRLDSRVFV